MTVVPGTTVTWEVMEKWTKHPFMWTVLIVLGLSVLTEVLQYFTRMGLCELDDLFDNLLGGLIGIGMLAGGGWLAERIAGKMKVM